MVNKKQAILLSVMCLWFATAFIISCYHAGTKTRVVSEPASWTVAEKEAIRQMKLPPQEEEKMLRTKHRAVLGTSAEWKFHWPHERRYHEDLTKLSLLVLPVFAICVPLWFNFRDSVPVSPAA